MEGALSQALPKFVQMGFIVPDVTKTLEEERLEEAQKMGKGWFARAISCPATRFRRVYRRNGTARLA